MTNDTLLESSYASLFEFAKKIANLQNIFGKIQLYCIMLAKKCKKLYFIYFSKALPLDPPPAGVNQTKISRVPLYIGSAPIF